MVEADRNKRLSTGVSGMDEILEGGLLPGSAVLVRGGPGTGKTTLGMHFLSQGIREGDACLWITLAEPEAQIRANAQRLGIELDQAAILELCPAAQNFCLSGYDLFHPSEVERDPLTQRLTEQMERLKPQRIFLDTMTQLRFLSSETFEFRRMAISFLRLLLDRGACVMFTSEASPQEPDNELQFIADAVITLSFSEETGRAVSVTKFRGSDFRSGRHSLRLTPRGMAVFPRMIPDAHARTFSAEPLPSGLPVLDQLLHGGLERGTITIVTGPTGVGKTTVGLQFMKEAAGRGERSVLYSFEEELEIMLHRAEALRIPARAMRERGTLALQKIEPLALSADEFACMVRREVEEQQARIVMIDSIAGYRLTLQGEDLVAHLHALCKYLQNMGVAVLLISEAGTLSGVYEGTREHVSFLADNTLFMRYVELHTEGIVALRKGIGVLKKRMSDFDRTLMEIDFTPYGIKVSGPMAGLSSILSEMPAWHKS